MDDILPRPAKPFPFKYAKAHCYTPRVLPAGRGEPEKTAEFEIITTATAQAGTAHQQMPIAITAKNSYCPVCRPKISENMQKNIQNHSCTMTSDTPVRQLIGQVSGLGDSFVVYY